MTAGQLCTACRTQLATRELKEPNSPSSPGEFFLVCDPCADRLQSLRLRPLEWFNLAALHTPHHFLLHDDFYEQDGTATAPEESVEDAESFPAPSLAQAAVQGIPRLVDHALSRWYLDQEEIAALRAVDPVLLLRELEERACRGSHLIEAGAYEICAAAVDRVAEPWIRARWPPREPSLWWPLVHALANCLPTEEGLALALAELDASGGNVDRAGALAWFRSERVLEWMESNVREAGTGGWGRLAAVSALSWPRVNAWITGGRPLNLVALDALLAIAAPDTLLLRSLNPKLARPPGAAELEAALQDLLARDASPRVRNAVAAISMRAVAITAGPDGPLIVP